MNLFFSFLICFFFPKMFFISRSRPPYRFARSPGKEPQPSPTGAGSVRDSHSGCGGRGRALLGSLVHGRRLHVGQQLRGPGNPLKPSRKCSQCIFEKTQVSLCIIPILSLELGLGHTNHVREPTLVTVLQNKGINQITAGRCHSAAWTAPSVPPRAPGQHTHTRLDTLTLHSFEIH